MPRKPKEILIVNHIYQDETMKFWSVRYNTDKFITGFITKDKAIEYCKENGYIIKGEI